MTIQSITTVLPVDHLPSAIASWRAILGVEPAFVDGERWAQFNIGAARIALAAGDQGGIHPGVMIKIADIEGQRDKLLENAVAVSEIRRGPHEVSFDAGAGDGWFATYYSPR